MLRLKYMASDPITFINLVDAIMHEAGASEPSVSAGYGDYTRVGEIVLRVIHAYTIRNKQDAEKVINFKAEARKVAQFDHTQAVSPESIVAAVPKVELQGEFIRRDTVHDFDSGRYASIQTTDFSTVSETYHSNWPQLEIHKFTGKLLENVIRKIASEPHCLSDSVTE